MSSPIEIGVAQSSGPRSPGRRGRACVRSLLLFTFIASGVQPAYAGDADSHITPDELLAAINSGHPPVILDVRTQGEYDAGHVPGAKHIPFYAVLARRAEISSPSQPLVVYCAHGPRAGIAKLQLWAAGFDHVRYLEGHMSA